MDKTCASCGTKLGADQGFCEACGTAWASPASTAIPTAAAVPDPPPVSNSVPVTRAGGSNRMLLVALVVIVALAALGAGGWFVMRPHGATSGSAASRSTRTIANPAATPAAAAPSAVTTPSSTPPLSPITADASVDAAASRPCSFVTREQMEQILGAKVVSITANETNCSYYTDITDRSLVASLDFTWIGGKDEFNTKKGFDSATLEKIDIGDDAYVQAAGVLNALKGDTYLFVNSRTLPNREVVEPAIARKVMETLQ